MQLVIENNNKSNPESHNTNRYREKPNNNQNGTRKMNVVRRKNPRQWQNNFRTPNTSRLQQQNQPLQQKFQPSTSQQPHPFWNAATHHYPPPTMNAHIQMPFQMNYQPQTQEEYQPF